MTNLIPYWLHSGERRCSGCDAGHALHVEVRCSSCDRPFCQHCVVFVRGEAFCAECRKEAGRK